MKIYYSTDFKGRWPVGTCAVVVASGRKKAIQLLNDELVRKNLPQDEPYTLQELDTNTDQALVLRDGDY